jgi:hypothetical protein
LAQLQATAFAQLQQAGQPVSQLQMIPESFLPAALPSALVSKLSRREYVNFDEALKLLEASASSHFDETPEADGKAATEAPTKGVKSLREWLTVFSAILHYVNDFSPADTRDYIAYLKGFVGLASRFPFRQAYEYDVKNRQYCARANFPLSVFKNELFMPMASPSPALVGQRQAAKRRASAPAAASSSARASKRSGGAWHQGVEICFAFNGRGCAEICPNGRAHVCIACRGDHAQSACNSGRVQQGNQGATSSPASVSALSKPGKST